MVSPTFHPAKDCKLTERHFACNSSKNCSVSSDGMVAASASIFDSRPWDSISLVASIIFVSTVYVLVSIVFSVTDSIIIPMERDQIIWLIFFCKFLCTFWANTNYHCEPPSAFTAKLRKYAVLTNEMRFLTTRNNVVSICNKSTVVVLLFHISKRVSTEECNSHTCLCLLYSLAYLHSGEASTCIVTCRVTSLLLFTYAGHTDLNYTKMDFMAA